MSRYVTLYRNVKRSKIPVASVIEIMDKLEGSLSEILQRTCEELQMSWSVRSKKVLQDLHYRHFRKGISGVGNESVSTITAAEGGEVGIVIPEIASAVMEAEEEEEVGNVTPETVIGWEGSTVDCNETPDQKQNEFDKPRVITRPIEQKPKATKIPEDKWREIMLSREGRTLKDLGWTNVVSDVLKFSNPFCSFVFRRHDVAVQISQGRGKLFTASGSCSFRGCPVKFKFYINKDKPFEGIATYSSDICVHNVGETVRRPIRGKKLRRNFAKKLENMSSVMFNIRQLTRLPEEVKQLGNRDGVPSIRALDQMRYEAHKEQRVHDNEMKALV